MLLAGVRAVAEKFLNENLSRISSKDSFAMWYRQYYRRYPDAGYGQMFSQWANAEEMRIQRSYGNGAAMRVTAIGLAYESLKDIKREVKDSCYYTHNHPEAIRGAQAVAAAVFMAKKQGDKDEIKRYVEKKFHYRFQSLDKIR